MKILVTGGARSGKSSYAENLYQDSKDVTYLATYLSDECDTEMAERVRKHQAQRPSNWKTIEIENTIDIKADKILFDCLSIYTSNIMYHYTKDIEYIGEDVQNQIQKHIVDEIQKLLENNSDVVIVTNEVGSATVPDNHVERVYRDLLGRVNCKVAKLVDKVLLVVCGCAIEIK
jgi:adenosylcobinamide kinase / adenosylcobinamide-phosphate guanylyltransferase